MTPEFSRIIALAELENDVTNKVFEATEPEKEALATRFGLLELKNLKANVILTKQENSEEPLRMETTFNADVVQECVVSLEPVPSPVNGAFNCVFAVEAAFEKDSAEIEIDPDSEDPPEILVDGRFDAGELIAEHFGLQIDPFPKAAGAVFDASTVLEEEEMNINNPFSVLKNLKDNSN